MKISLLLTIFTFLSSYSFSQTTKEAEENYLQNNKVSQSSFNQPKVKVLSLNLIGISKDIQGDLKDEFSTYKKKVVSIDYNEYDETMIVKYFGLSDEKISIILDKFQLTNDIIN